MQESINQKIRELLIPLGNLPPDFSPQADLYADLGMPSVKAMQLLVELEETFSVAIPDEDFVESTSLDKLTALIGRLQSGSPS